MVPWCNSQKVRHQRGHLNECGSFIVFCSNTYINYTTVKYIYIYKRCLRSSRTCIHCAIHRYLRCFTSGDASGTRLLWEKIDVSTQTARQEWWTSRNDKIHIQKRTVFSNSANLKHGKFGQGVLTNILKLAHFHNFWFKKQFSKYFHTSYVLAILVCVGSTNMVPTRCYQASRPGTIAVVAHCLQVHPTTMHAKGQLNPRPKHRAVEENLSVGVPHCLGFGFS